MLVIVLAMASLGCFALGVHYLRQALALTGTAASYIRSAAQGYVVLVGEGAPMTGRPLVAPFSGKPCVWWSTQVEPLFGNARAFADGRRTVAEVLRAEHGRGTISHGKGPAGA